MLREREPCDLMLRPMNMRAAAGVLVALCLALSGCRDNRGASLDGGPTVRVHYGITYNVSANDYDDRTAKHLLGRCLDLPGASSAGQEGSRPPRLTVVVDGRFFEQDAVFKCLKGLPGARVTGPFPARG